MGAHPRRPVAGALSSQDGRGKAVGKCSGTIYRHSHLGNGTDGRRRNDITLRHNQEQRLEGRREAPKARDAGEGADRLGVRTETTWDEYDREWRPC